MTDRITTTCQHSHTVTLRHDADALGIIGASWAGGEEFHLIFNGGSYAVPIDRMRPAIRAELVAALAAAEASCGGCGCAERLRAEAERLAPEDADKALRLPTIDEVRAFWMDRAADFLDAAPDARGEGS